MNNIDWLAPRTQEERSLTKEKTLVSHALNWGRKIIQGKKESAEKYTDITSQLPSFVLDIFRGSFDKILEQPLYTFDKDTIQDYFSDEKTRDSGYRKYRGGETFFWLQSAKVTSAVQRFVDPYGRIGFLFSLRDEKYDRSHLVCLQESMPVFSSHDREKGYWVMHVLSEDIKIQEIFNRKIPFQGVAPETQEIFDGLKLLANHQQCALTADVWLGTKSTKIPVILSPMPNA